MPCRDAHWRILSGEMNFLLPLPKAALWEKGFLGQKEREPHTILQELWRSQPLTNLSDNGLWNQMRIKDSEFKVQSLPATIQAAFKSRAADNSRTKCLVSWWTARLNRCVRGGWWHPSSFWPPRWQTYNVSLISWPTGWKEGVLLHPYKANLPIWAPDPASLSFCLALTHASALVDL